MPTLLRLGRLLFILTLSLVADAQRTSCSEHTKPWHPQWAEKSRDDLLCSATDCPDPGPGLKMASKDVENCCTCFSCTTWEGNEKELVIEYISVIGRNLLLSNQAPNNAHVYKVVHRDSDMTEIPGNICNWNNDSSIERLYGGYFHNMSTFLDNLVIMDFTGNKIRSIPDINCLKKLDQLILAGNHIQSVSNTSFIHLSRLRYINIESNHLKTLDPGIFTSPSLHIFLALFRNNSLEKFDVSNIFSMYPFCEINVGDNKITEVVNENNFKLDMNMKIGSGSPNLSGNPIEQFPNLKDLFRLDSWDQIGKLENISFKFRSVPIICDCHLQPFLSQTRKIIEIVFRNYNDITCSGPEEHKGKILYTMKPEELVCSLSQRHGCQQPECTCVDKPNDDTLYIDCSGQNLKTLPYIPTSNLSKYYSLNVSGNQIKEIGNIWYLAKLRSLDISNNDLLEINDDIGRLLENCTEIDISNNPKLRNLPESFRYRDICKVHMRNLVIACNCETSWLETSIETSACEMEFHCDIPDEGIKSPREFHVSNLNCFLDSLVYILISINAGVALLLIISSALVYRFRYELLIIFRRLRQTMRNVVLPYNYDVFVSFNENERHVNDWILKSLIPRLQESGYTTFLALKDVPFGAERNSEVNKAIQNSHNFLIVLSNGYLEKADEGIRSWTENEWKFGWNNFRKDRGKNIVLVNFDHLEPSDIDDVVIRAYVRVGCTVDFKNHTRDIMDDIETKLGKPMAQHVIDTKGNDNTNKKFTTPIDLFVTSLYSGNDDDFEIELDEQIKHDKNNVGEQLKRRKYPLVQKQCKYRQCVACEQKKFVLKQ